MATRFSNRQVRLKPDATSERYVQCVVSAFRRTVVGGAVVLACCTLGAQQADRERTEALARRAGERLRTLQQEADRLASEERTLLGDLRKLEIERQIKAEEFRQVDADLAAAATELAATNDQARHLEQEELAQRRELRARLVEMYELGQGRYLRLLLSTTDVRRVGQASRMVAALAKRDRDQIAAYQRRLAELTTTRKSLEARGTRLAALRADAERARASADRAVQARDALIRDIDQRRDLNAQLAGELQAAQQKLQLTLRDVASGVAASELAALPLRPFQGDLDWPVAGTVRQRFGRTGAARPASNGIEIAAREGASVHAVHEGVVAFADTFAGFGNLVILDHGAQTFSLYGNLLETAVRRGARVERGQAVGSVGPSATGATEAAGLYFDLRIDGRPVDPLQWLKRR